MLNSKIAIGITGTGLYHPPHSITNEALVEAYNAYVARCEAEHDGAPGDDSLPLRSDPEFIVKASGIERRYAVDPEGILDPGRMRPRLRVRDWDEPSLQCEMAIEAATEALEAAGRVAGDIDLVIVGCSNLQRAYPAIAIEVQSALGAGGYAFDMNVACSTATFALQAACDALRGGSASRALVVNPEICTAHLNFRDRDCHFIFGDACTAMVIEPLSESTSSDAKGPVFEILATRAQTHFSNNIRNDYGFLSPTEDRPADDRRLLFNQQGRAVFKQVAPMVVALIREQLEDEGVAPEELARLWLHQANATMNRHIATKVLGRAPSEEEAPTILDEFANTSSAGSVIALHRHSADLEPGALGLLTSFGAGYSIGSVLLRRR